MTVPSVNCRLLVVGFRMEDKAFRLMTKGSFRTYGKRFKVENCEKGFCYS